MSTTNKKMHSHLRKTTGQGNVLVGEFIIQSMTAARGRGRRLSDAQRLTIIDELTRPGARSNAVLAASYGVSAKAVREL